MKAYLYKIIIGQEKGILAGFLRSLLFLLSLIYGLIVRLLIAFYGIKPSKLGCKVISVGNITLGGTGKTTLVEFICAYLQKQGHKVAVLSRGYKRAPGLKGANLPGQPAKGLQMGDEPYMLQANLKSVPVLVGGDRIRSAKLAVTYYGADSVVLDDGFQQWRIKKDLEIVAIDAGNPFGNKNMLPGGILREPLSSLKRADIFVITKANLHPDVRELTSFLTQTNPQALVVETAHYPLGFYELGQKNGILKSSDIFKGKTACVLSGIGDPDSFDSLVASLGIKIGLSFRFGDHHNYSRMDLDKINQACQEKDIELILTTEKDSVRLQLLPATCCRLPIFILRIELKIIKNEEKFLSRFTSLYYL